MEVNNFKSNSLQLNITLKPSNNKIIIDIIDQKPNINIKVSSSSEINCNDTSSLDTPLYELYEGAIEKAKEELREASHHLAYEFSMLINSYFLYAYLSGIVVKNHIDFSSVFQLINNMRVEALRIHARVLLEFFERRNGNKKRFDDIVYEDFFCPLLNSNTFAPSFSNNIKDIKDKIHLTTAHLSYIRVDQPKQDREPNLNEINQVIEEICDNMSAFYNAINKDLLDNNAKNIIHYALNNCKTLTQQSNTSNPTNHALGNI